MSDADIDTLVAEATEGIPDEAIWKPVSAFVMPISRSGVAKKVSAALRTEKRPARPNFPEEWRSQPNVMFDQNDPTPEPFDWGPPKWATEAAYDKDLARFLGDLACASDVHEAQTRGLARRAIVSSYLLSDTESDLVPDTESDLLPQTEEDRMWPKLLAARLIGQNCPLAKGLPDDMRSLLEEIAARRNTSPEAPEASPQASK